MKHRMFAALFFVLVMGLARGATAQGATCAGKAPGKYCTSNPQMIMTCAGTGAATAVDCGVAVAQDGTEIIGRCVSTGPNDNKAVCKSTPPAGPCAGKAPGKYCVGQMIMTCTGQSSGTAVGCGVAVAKDGKELIGRCVSTGPNDNKAVCKTSP